MLKTFAVLAAFFGPLSYAAMTTPQKSVNTIVGGNITLLCTYNTKMDASTMFIQWSFYSARERHKNVIYYSQGDTTYSYGEFKNRIQAVNSTGNASITIFNMKSSETGQYTCEVFNPTDPTLQTEKTIAVNVLVPPSQPHCYLHGTLELGHLISLYCFAEHGLPPPTYQWQKVSGDTVKNITESYSSKTGAFFIGNLTNLEEGYYRCTAANSLGYKSCQINISSSQTGVIVGALIGAILVIALICGVIWFLTSKEKKKKRKEKTAMIETQDVSQKEPLNAEYTAVPNQESVPLSTVPPSKGSTETNEYVAPEEIEVRAEPENEMQEEECQPEA